MKAYSRGDLPKHDDVRRLEVKVYHDVGAGVQVHQPPEHVTADVNEGIALKLLSTKRRRYYNISWPPP